MSKKRVLHFVYTINRGGTEEFFMNVFRHIDKDRFEFDFLTTGKNGVYEDEIIELGGNILTIMEGRNIFMLRPFFRAYNIYKALKPLKGKYDVFHTHEWRSLNSFLNGMAARCAGIKKIVIHSHNTNAPSNIWAHKLFVFFLNRMNITALACSDLAGKWMYGGGGFKVINNGIDIKKYEFSLEKRKKIRESYNVDDKFVIGHVGRFSEQKNHKYIIEIFRHVYNMDKDVVLLLCGDGELSNTIKEKAWGYGIDDRIIYAGEIDNGYEMYSGFDLLVFPSLYEGLGIVLIEAQSSNLPCIISDTIPEAATINDDVYRLGIFCDPKVWAEKIIELKSEKNQRKTDNSKIQKAGYYIKDSVKELEKIYLE